MSVGMISSQVVFNGSITSDKPRLDNEFITISRVSMAIKVFDRNSAVDETYLSPVHLSPFPLYILVHNKAAPAGATSVQGVDDDDDRL